MKVLVTGGTGYIGSHACVELLQAGCDVVAVDNLCNSRRTVLERIEAIAGRTLSFCHADIRDAGALRAIFAAHEVGAVIHFAALKAVGESVAQPLRYYDNNVSGSVTLFEAMAECGVRNLVFSSSTSVYGDPPVVPIREDSPLKPISPYGRSKLMVEEVLRDLSASDNAWNIALLRYFNVVGAHDSGLIGEDPVGTPQDLIPYVAKVAAGVLPELPVFGGDYPTPDGTALRDYIHVTDLVLGHLKALEKLRENPGVVTYNLGTGKSHSVLEMVAAFEKASGRKVPYRIVGRRPGDVAVNYADPGLAQAELGWTARRGIDQMCADAWRWQSQGLPARQEQHATD